MPFLATKFRSFSALLVVYFLITLQNTCYSQYRFLENGTSIHRGLEAGYLLESPTRTKIDLSGVWSFRIKDGPDGLVRVPSAYDFTGEVTFERKVDFDSAAFDGTQFHLVMLGSNYNTSVSINNDFVANHIGGYTTFIAPISTSILQIGKENIIRITTDNTLSATRTLPLRSQVWGWRNYGGILRDVYIMGTPRVFIADVFASSDVSKDRNSARMTVTATVDSDARSLRDTATTQFLFMAELFDKQTDALIATSKRVPVTRLGKEWNSVSVELQVPNPRLWSPSKPDRYFLKTYLMKATTSERVDEYYINTGIRQLEIVDGSLVLNGERLHLKGLVWMEDHPSFGSSLTLEEMEKDVALIRSLGANAIRFGYHPPHPYMLNLCDRYGLMALVELSVKNVPASILASEYYVELAMNRLRETIIRDRNHPSVLAWGLGDEFESRSPDSRKFVEPLVTLARSLDDRPVYYGTRYQYDDASADLVDMVAVTLTTRDIKLFKRQLDSLRQANPSKPVIIAKMGTEVQPNNRNGYSDPLSYEGQARYMLQHVDAIRSSNIDGAFIWSFNDWKGDRPSLTVRSGDPWMHTLGVVSYAREKRLAYEALRTVFNNEKFSALPIGNNPASSPIIYVVSGLVLLIGTAYLYNSSRRFRESLNRSTVNSYNFFADVRDQRIVTVLHSTILGLIVSSGTAIVLSSLLNHFQSSFILDNTLSYILVTDKVKEVAVRLIRDPKEFLVVFTGGFFLLLVLISLLVWAAAPLLKARIYPFHSYAVTMWSTPPLLVLVPIGMILFRLIESPMYVLPSVVIIALLFIWVIFRFLKGTSIILDIYPLKVYGAGFIAIAGIITAAYFYLDHTEAAGVYVKYLYNDLVSRVW